MDYTDQWITDFRALITDTLDKVERGERALPYAYGVMLTIPAWLDTLQTSREQDRKHALDRLNAMSGRVEGFQL